MGDKAICERLQAVFPDGLPTDDEVRAQEIEFLADHWLKRWPEDLEVPDFLVPGTRLKVSRQELFDRAAKVDSPSEALELYVWMAGWGTGTGARAVGRSAQVLQNSNVAELLWQSFSNVQEIGAVEAYRRLYTWGEDRLKYFGPAFFTKWLYFACYDSWTGTSQAPLILDSLVAATLGCRSTGWSSTEYGRYLDKVEQIRQTCAPDESSHVIEFALFRAGRKRN